MLSSGKRHCFYLALWISAATFATAQTVQQVSVQLTAEANPAQPAITLNWVADPEAGQYFVYRKSPGSANWGEVLATLPGSATVYTDTAIIVGQPYEYRILRQGTGYQGFGYIVTGIQVPWPEMRKVVILMIDSTFLQSLADRIDRLEDDLEGDGWTVRKAYAGRSETPQIVKGRIVSLYQEDPAATKSLFLLGHVPVPYSGAINPDGHPDHLGAWPADVYYADMNGAWTDVSINTTVATGTRNDNVPGDGKFDQNLLPGDVELEVGRVDLSDLPLFAASEEDLMAAYLDKNHAYRHRMVDVSRRAVIDDNFGYFSGEAFAASAWKSLAPLVGPENIGSGDYFTALSDSSALWSYGCGGGSYTSAGGVGNTGQFAGSNLQTVFTMLFGSYFGDWDVTNSFLRAPLAQGLTLANAWSGRPHWAFHAMGLGETLGYCARRSQNNNGTYFSMHGSRQIHIALMGDPTLRQDMLTPPGHVEAEPTTYGVDIAWTPSPDAGEGYRVYGRRMGEAAYTLWSEIPAGDTTWQLVCAPDTGCYEIMVCAVALTERYSGSYINLSQGVTTSFCQWTSSEVTAGASADIEESTVAFSNTSTNADSYFWVFGDGVTSDEEHPVHTYLDGDFTAMLIASNACDADTVLLDFTIFTSIGGAYAAARMRIDPNPAADAVWITRGDNRLPEVQVRIFSADGRQMYSGRLEDERTRISLVGFPPGIYGVFITGRDFHQHLQLVRM